MSTSKVIELAFWPEGCDPDEFDGIDWMIVVQWRGNDLYAILQRGARDIQLSRAGNWKICPLPMQRRQYRFTFEEATAMAEKIVETNEIAGMTYAQFQVWKAAHAKGE